MKFQKNTKGKGILKFGLSDEEKSKAGKSEAGSSHSTTYNDSQTQGKDMLKKMTQGAADQLPLVKI